ncbi:MAG: hypothetical protein HDR30_08250 [Lachnospiraceae bacterium]|nr:hypothetical protein [Lachnospiraceae bacterium]
MNQTEIDFLNFENDLLQTRKKLNDLIYLYSQNPQTPENKAIYQGKIFYLEKELKYMNEQFQMLKDRQTAQQNVAQSMTVSMPQQTTPQTSEQHPQMQMSQQTFRVYPQMPPAVPPEQPRKDYEKLFGKSFMGIFASVLIFISLIIFATLMMPYLTDTMKLFGLYILSFGLLSAGFLLSRKNPANKFYLAVIGCGIGSLYISLLLSDFYFKVIGDILLYVFILVWAVFVRYVSRLKSLVFHVIGHLGIFIATMLGTVLCVNDNDIAKFLVLTVFYFISAVVFSNAVFSIKEKKFLPPKAYEDNLCNHIFKTLNLLVLTIGIFHLDMAGLRTITIVLILLFILSEYYFSYREECRHGIAFQLLTIANFSLFFYLLHQMELWSEDVSVLLTYLLSIALLFYITKKNAGYQIVSELYCFLIIFLSCYNGFFIGRHLYAYFTAIPFMLYGGLKQKKPYLYAGIAFLIAFFRLDSDLEHLIMAILVYAVFLYLCPKLDDLYFRLFGYLMLTLITILLVHDCTYTFLERLAIESIDVKTNLITFFVIAALHLILSKLEYLGVQRPIKIMMYLINGVLMIAGCFYLYDSVWQIPLILITVLIFMVNSKRLLQEDARAGYYVALKYTVLMVCILTSYNAANYFISICLLLFAILSIIIGFYKNTVTFRLYGLILSMVSVFKLIMIDIKYDSTLENAVSFFVSGILCFIISFLYNKIDHSLKKSSPTNGDSETQ